ncbi:MAG: 16S rRNA (cytosine(1402)-N(4))-methyltransferase RsmH [Victivallales bacterium]|nr:16S rRNA (cytosine(1402)-N(4))-methyltransferase RsmH [Victivallales bacterium]
MSTAPFEHTTVLLHEAVDILCGGGGHRFLDCTLGGGGHSQLILEANPDNQVLGLDCDERALAAASARLDRFGSRFTAVHGRFAQAAELARAQGWSQVDGALMDIGVSSPQIDDAERGFSFRFDGPLDMRMDSSTGQTAADILNTADEKTLADILFQYGEERRSRAIARAVVERRSVSPWRRTGEFAELVERIVGKAHQYGLPPATRSFQALRIAVNDELGQLRRCLESLPDLLAPGGRLVVITFHSLEDRIVKDFFREGCRGCTCPPDFPVCVCGKKPQFRLLTKKPLVPGEEEQRTNRRSRCAKLRAVEKC